MEMEPVMPAKIYSRKNVWETRMATEFWVCPVRKPPATTAQPYSINSSKILMEMVSEMLAKTCSRKNVWETKMETVF